MGTGRARTGTTTLKIALEHLGFGKCYHMWELMNHPVSFIILKRQNGVNM
jgi:hypothetical protein